MPSKRLTLLLGALCGIVVLGACRFELPRPPADRIELPSSLLTANSPLSSPLDSPLPGAVATPVAEPPGFLPGELLGSLTSNQKLLLIVLGAVGLSLLTGLLVFVVLRGRSGRRSPRARSAEAGTAVTEGDPGLRLPEGTLLGEGHFVILDGRAVDKGHVYEVKPTTPMRVCPRCYSVTEATDSRHCARCGQAYTNGGAAYTTLLAREALDPQRFAMAAQLVTREVAHTAVITPVAVFVDTSFEPVRYFQIEPRITGGLAAGLDVPQPLDDVLTWGTTLARGLAHLHARGVFVERVAAERVVLDDESGHWVCLDNIYVAPPQGDPEAGQRAVANIRGLAHLLLTWATGSTKLKACSELPEPVGRLLLQALKGEPALTAEGFAVALERAREQLTGQRRLSLRVGARTDVGQMRKLNEDSLIVLDLSKEFAALKAAVGVFGVADGVGGNAAGDVASQLTVKTLTRYGDDLRRSAAARQLPDARAWITQAAMAANEAVYAEREAMSSDMGCTLVMGVIVGGAATVLNAGDSRAYRLGSRGIRQITTDHSVVQRLVEIGQLRPEEARHHPQKSVIYRVIGDSLTLGYDLFDVTLTPGEALLFCSDGLTDMVEDEVVWRTWREASAPQAACDRLVQMANDAGGHDNISVVIVEVHA